MVNKDDPYFNFINTLNSELTKQKYSYYLEQFLQYCKIPLNKFLKLPEDKISDFIIKYLVQKKVSRSFDNVELVCCDKEKIIKSFCVFSIQEIINR